MPAVAQLQDSRQTNSRFKEQLPTNWKVGILCLWKLGNQHQTNIVTERELKLQYKSKKICDPNDNYNAQLLFWILQSVHASN